MRNFPVAVYRVACKAATQLIKNAAPAHAFQREAGDMTGGVLHFCVARFRKSPQAKFDHLGMRKFWRSTKATAFGIKRARHLLISRVDQAG